MIINSKIKIKGYKSLEDVSLSEMHWKDKALCSDKELSLFFSSPKSDSTLIAFSICKSCPVRAECLYEAFTYGYDGTWGGSTLDQRQAIVISYFDANVTNIKFSQLQSIIQVVDKIGKTKNLALIDINNSKLNLME